MQTSVLKREAIFIYFKTNKENTITYKTLVDTNVDFLFILNEKLEMYLIPKNEMHNKSTLNLCKKYKKYLVKF